MYIRWATFSTYGMGYPPKKDLPKTRLESLNTLTIKDSRQDTLSGKLLRVYETALVFVTVANRLEGGRVVSSQRPLISSQSTQEHFLCVCETPLISIECPEVVDRVEGRGVVRSQGLFISC